MGDLWLICIVLPCVSIFHPVISGLSDSLTTEILQNTSFSRWDVGDVDKVVHLAGKCPAIPADLKRPNMEVQDVSKVIFLRSSPPLTRKILSCYRPTAVSNYLQSAIASCFFPFCLWFGVKELSLFLTVHIFLCGQVTQSPTWRNLWMSVWGSTEKFLSLACLKIKQRKSIQSFLQSCSKSTKPWKTPIVEKMLWWLPSHALRS